MEDEVKQIIIDWMKALDTKVDNITERLIRLEERTSRKAGLYGLLGGLIPTVGLLIFWIVSK